MKKLSLFIALLFSMQIVSAQFGFSAGYKPINANNWEKIIESNQTNSLGGSNAVPLAHGAQVGIDYWFRLKNYRVEFLPELSFSTFKRVWQNPDGTTLSVKEQLNSSFLGLHFNTNFYIFDFKGDCNCPTFGKQGPDAKKGFFIQVAPGVDYVFNSFKKSEETKTVNDIVPSIGIGIGVDFGLTNLLTLTPMVKMHHYFGVDWDGLNTYFEAPSQPISDEFNKNNITQFFVGVRIGLRLDSNNY
jgi:hypothetical protein